MIVDILKYLARLIVLLFLQVFIISKLNISTYINLNLIIYFLLLLPINLLPALTLIISFAAGLTLDMFSDTPGYSSTSMLVAAFARIYYIRSFAHVDIAESGCIPDIVNMGMRWFLFYATTIVLVFHFVYVFLQSFTFSYFFSNIIETALSTLATLLMVLLAEFLFYRSKFIE